MCKWRFEASWFTSVLARKRSPGFALSLTTIEPHPKVMDEATVAIAEAMPSSSTEAIPIESRPRRSASHRSVSGERMLRLTARQEMLNDASDAGSKLQPTKFTSSVSHHDRPTMRAAAAMMYDTGW